MYESISQLGQRSTSPAYCCGDLAKYMGPKVTFPGNSTYLATQASYFTLQEAHLSPACIVVPETADDVADAVSVLSRYDDCHFAIKCQGHAPAAGFANIDNGVTIDMTRLDSVTVDSSQTVASVGAGASWLDVYMYLDTLGLAVAGGRNGAVGVGGLTLGGGISFFAPRVGWACDNVVNFEIVLPSGELANINAHSRADLFRALKGGTNNFGIVTRFDLKAFPQGQIVGGSVAQNISYREAVFKALADIAGATNYDPYASIVTGLIFNSISKAWTLSSTPVYTLPILNPPVYDELLAIPSTSNTLKLTNLSTQAAEKSPPPLDWLFYTGTYGVSAQLLCKIFDYFNATMYTFNIPGGVTWSVALEPLPTAITQYGDTNGGNSLGTTPNDGNAIILLLAGFWSDTASNDVVEETARKMGREVAEIARSMNLLRNFQYINYADPSQDPIRSYGAENAKFLRDTSRKYDPKGVFQRQVPGGFKLGLHNDLD